MSALSLKNLKDNPERLATLIDKVKKGSPFTRVGGDVEEKRDDIYLEFLYPEIENALLEKKGLTNKDISGAGKNKIFRNKKTGDLISLSQLEKTAELGSSKGSGGGANATATTESMQCYFASYLFNGPENKFDLSKDYEKALKLYFSKQAGEKYVHAYDKTSRFTFKDLWKQAPKDEEWMQTYMATANLIKMISSKFKKPVYFHRGSPFMDSIYEKKKTCEKHNRDLIKAGEKLSQIQESVATFTNDKWNPGDIWMSTNEPKDEPFSWTPPDMKKNMKVHVCDWANLQMAVYQSAINGETQGISLKKTGKNANFKAFNVPNEKSPVRFTGYKFGDGDFFNSVDVYIEFSGGSMQYRPTDGNQSWQGEIKGTKASGGKAGGGSTNYYSELYFGKSIDANTKLASGTWKEKKGTIEGKDITKMHELYVIHNKNQTAKKRTAVKIKKTAEPNPLENLSTGPKGFSKTEDNKFYVYTCNTDNVSLGDFKILGDTYEYRGKNASKNFYFGKYMALVFIDLISSRQGGVVSAQDGFATDIVRYAQSNIDNVSTYFWKIS
jgi:hypothetical protein